MSSGDSFAWLQRWYRAQCKGDWEHSYGVRIDTLDNPGWTLDIDLTGTQLERELFAPTKVERSEDDWIDGRVEKVQFRGVCGPENLGELIALFRTWADAVDGALRCRVCGLVQDERPWGTDGRGPTYVICDCCGVEFGYEDCTKESTLAYRSKWLASGGEWRDATSRPAAWDRDGQLTRIPAAFRSE